MKCVLRNFFLVILATILNINHLWCSLLLLKQMERGTVYCFIFFQELCFSELLFFFIWLKLVLATFTLCFCALVKMSFPSSPASGRYSQYGAITVPVTVFALNFVIVGSWTIQSNYQQCQKIPCIIINTKKNKQHTLYPWHLLFAVLCSASLHLAQDKESNIRSTGEQLPNEQDAEDAEARDKISR